MRLSMKESSQPYFKEREGGGGKKKNFSKCFFVFFCVFCVFCGSIFCMFIIPSVILEATSEWRVPSVLWTLPFWLRISWISSMLRYK